MKKNLMLTSLGVRETGSGKMLLMFQSMILGNRLGFCTCPTSVVYVINFHFGYLKNQNIKILNSMAKFLELPYFKVHSCRFYQLDKTYRNWQIIFQLSSSQKIRYTLCHTAQPRKKKLNKICLLILQLWSLANNNRSNNRKKLIKKVSNLRAILSHIHLY